MASSSAGGANGRIDRCMTVGVGPDEEDSDRCV